MSKGLSRGHGRGMGGRHGTGRGKLNAGGIMGAQSVSKLPNNPEIVQGSPIETAPGREFTNLKTQAKNLEEQLRAINVRIKELEESGKGFKRIAFVDSDRCMGCGICEWVCPNGAISVGEKACIDSTKCTGCGRCIAKCPQKALSLRKI